MRTKHKLLSRGVIIIAGAIILLFGSTYENTVDKSSVSCDKPLVNNDRGFETLNNNLYLHFDEYIKEQKIKEEIKSTPTPTITPKPKPTKKPENTLSTNRWGIKLSNSEIDLLAKIVWAESRGESDIGQQSIVEVVFNRMRHKQYGGSLKTILSKENAFSTWRGRNRANPTKKEYNNIKKVLDGKTNILNFNTTYFSTKPRYNNYKKIGAHYFCEWRK